MITFELKLLLLLVVRRDARLTDCMLNCCIAHVGRGFREEGPTKREEGLCKRGLACGKILKKEGRRPREDLVERGPSM
jgi:hypothetical protein